MKLFDMKDYLHASLKGVWNNIEFEEIKMDSKEINPGDIFLAYGKGYEYIDEAISLGARAIITEREIGKKEVPVLQVKNSLIALTSLAILKRQHFKGKVIAITGSNGKTSTKELLKFLLSFDKKVLANFESENNHIGVPKTLLKVNDQYDYVLLELGMNHVGEMRHLSKIAKPDIGIITNIGTAHIGNLGSKDAIFKAKMELVEETPEMTLFVNGLDPYLKQVSGNKVYLEYEALPSIPAIDVNLACKVCEYLGYEKTEMKRRLSSFPGVKSRMQFVKINDKLVIDDAYNASYESICFGLESLSTYPTRKIFILGDMLELGEFSEQIHKEIYDKILTYSDIFLITIGKELSFLHHKPHFYSLEDLKEYLKSFSFFKGDILYLKASHGIGLSKLVPYLKNIL